MVNLEVIQYIKENKQRLNEIIKPYEVAYLTYVASQNPIYYREVDYKFLYMIKHLVALELNKDLNMSFEDAMKSIESLDVNNLM